MTLGDTRGRTTGLERVRTILLWVVACAAVLFGLTNLMGNEEGTLANVLLAIVVVGGVLMGITYLMHLARRRSGTR